MLALSIHYLNGWAMAAADGAKKERAEWPPHPDRVFMALAAAWFETGEDPEEGAALHWLEALEPPHIFASDASFRIAAGEDRPPISYVPVNDIERGRRVPNTNEYAKLIEAGLALLPVHRPRKERRFPVAVPKVPVVVYIWSKIDDDRHRDALKTLAPKVTHVGHPASFVQVCLPDAPPTPNWMPVDGQAALRLRVFAEGRLLYLKERYNGDVTVAHADLRARIAGSKGREKRQLQSELSARFGRVAPVSLRPEAGLWQGYDRPLEPADAEVPGSVFDPRLTVLSLSGKRLSLPATARVVEALRGAILSTCRGTVPEWISGQGSDGKASSHPHLALLPLPFVGHEHADGRLMGLALAFPKGVDPRETARCLGAFLHDENGLPRRTRLFAGEWLECSAELEVRETPPSSLQPESWTRQSRTWATVTPIAWDRHSGGRDMWHHAAEMIKDACERIGLPRPKEVLPHTVSWVVGVPESHRFPCLTRKRDGGGIQHSHAVIVFEQEVAGPVAVGAGRFRGYGLCRPIDQG